MATDVRVMLARRPPKAGLPAFGHVDVSQAGRTGLTKIASDLYRREIKGRLEIAFNPTDRAEEGEVLATPLKGFDAFYQQSAAWSLERAVNEIRATGLPAALGKSGITGGHWSFYAIRVKLSSKLDAVFVRGRSPTYGLGDATKLVTTFTGTELKPVTSPLLAFDHAADVIVIGSKAYVINPGRAEAVFVDADAVKKRAPQTAAAFTSGLAASVTQNTADAIERLCSKNFFVARRVERLNAAGGLGAVNATELRGALPDAGLTTSAFGTSGPLKAESDKAAGILIDLAADLYYQPRFDKSSRRVGSYRTV